MRELAQKDRNLQEIETIGQYCQSPSGLDTYLRQYWTYVPDPDWAEYVRGAEYQLEIAKVKGHYEGDCDDAATFAATVCLAMGWPCAFVAYRMNGNPEFSHVNLRCTSNDVDPTVRAESLPVRSEEELYVWL